MASVAPDVVKPAGEDGRQAGATWRHAHPVLSFLARRLTAGLATLLVATFLIFGAVELLPGDVASLVLGRTGTPQRLAAVRADLHLNHPFLTRYVGFLGNVLTGHFGNSSAALAQGQRLSVWSVIHTPLRNSLELALVTLVIFIPLCLLLGTIAALRAGRATDHAISATSLALGAMPEFLIGTLLILIFFTELNLLPPVAQINPGQTPFTNPKILVLPVATLLGVSVAFGTRLVRASVIEVLGQEYVAMARLNGQPERRVILRYALRNALAPSIQVVAQMIQYLIGGIIITESVFNYPGIGNLIVQSVSVRDVQETMVIATILAAIYILVNVIADLVVMLLVPKLRTQA